MTLSSMKSSSAQPSTWPTGGVGAVGAVVEVVAVDPSRRGTATRRGRPAGGPSLPLLGALIDAEHVDRDEDREERAAGYPPADHVDRVVRAEVDAGGADRTDDGRGRGVRDEALAVVVRQARDAEGGHAVEDRRPQRVPRRKVGDIVEADPVDVEHRTDQDGEADRLRRCEVLQRPLHREAEGAEGEQEGEVATSAREGEQPESGEGDRHEPPAAERADADDQRVDQGQVRFHPAVDRGHDRRHQPLLGQRRRGRALEHHQPEERGQRHDGKEEGRGRARDGSAQAMRGLVMNDEAAHGVRQPSHGA